jgi:hypothetical protein
VLELGSLDHQQLVIDLLLANLSEYATHEHGIKSVLKATKESSGEVKNKFVDTLCRPSKG